MNGGAPGGGDNKDEKDKKVWDLDIARCKTWFLTLSSTEGEA